MNRISLDRISVNYALSEILISDYFIDQRSMQQGLKTTYHTAFKKGRFKEFFMPILGRKIEDKLNFEDPSITTGIPIDNHTVITPIYGCPDACCIYLFAKVRRVKETISWIEIGKNKMFMPKDVSGENIEWLPGFSPLRFDMKEYRNIIAGLNPSEGN